MHSCASADSSGGMIIVVVIVVIVIIGGVIAGIFYMKKKQAQKAKDSTPVTISVASSDVQMTSSAKGKADGI